MHRAFSPEYEDRDEPGENWLADVALGAGKARVASRDVALSAEAAGTPSLQSQTRDAEQSAPATHCACFVADDEETAV